MARGFFSGVITGTAAAFLGAVGLSVAVSLPDILAQSPVRTDQVADTSEAAPDEAPVSNPVVEAMLPGDSAEEAEAPEDVAEVAPEMSEPQDGNGQGELVAEQSVPVPEAEKVAEMPDAPEPQVPDAPELAMEPPAPQNGDIAVAGLDRPEPATSAPGISVAPEGETSITVEATPSLPKAAPPTAEIAVDLDSPAQVDDSLPELAATAPVDAPDLTIALTGPPDEDRLGPVDAAPARPKAAPQTAEAPSVPQVPQTSDAPVIAGAEPDSPPQPAEIAALPQPDQGDTQVSADTTTPVPPATGQAEPDTQTAMVDPEAERPSLPSIVTDEPAPEVSQNGARPSIGTPAKTLETLANGVTQKRLPSVLGRPEDTPVPVAQPGAADTAKAVQRFAAKADVAQGAPRLSVILVDDLKGPLGANVVETFPFPVTFAIDASAEGATEAMQAYRAKGFEVVALARLPQGAQPADVEVAMAAMLSAVPESVAILEGPDIGLQSDRAVARQVRDYVQGTGHGILFQSKGLNSAAGAAQRDGVPAATVIATIDGQAQGTDGVRRALDKAAFKARQDGSVVLMGPLNADTVSALLLWAMQERDDALALVPVSNILIGGADQG